MEKTSPCWYLLYLSAPWAPSIFCETRQTNWNGRPSEIMVLWTDTLDYFCWRQLEQPAWVSVCETENLLRSDMEAWLSLLSSAAVAASSSPAFLLPHRDFVLSFIASYCSPPHCHTCTSRLLTQTRRSNSFSIHTTQCFTHTTICSLINFLSFPHLIPPPHLSLWTRPPPSPHPLHQPLPCCLL